MEFRPCIDIHNGSVKQIVGGSLRDEGAVSENFVATKSAADYAKLYASDGLKGGHVILLNAKDSPSYQATKEAAFSALQAYPSGLQVGGGIDSKNAHEFLDAGASHVIVTSYVFRDGMICYNHLTELQKAVGKEHIVLDLSCRKMSADPDFHGSEDAYRIVTDRWQKFTTTPLSKKLLSELAGYCDEFLVHAVDVEGKVSGIEEGVVTILKDSPIPVTYAGGIAAIDDLKRIRELGDGRVNVTIGSALSLFGGSLDYREVLQCIRSWS